MRRDPRRENAPLWAVLGHLAGARWLEVVEHRRILVLWRAVRADDGRPRWDAEGRPVMETVLRVLDLDTGDEVEVWDVHVPASASGVTEADARAAFEARSVRGFA